MRVEFSQDTLLVEDRPDKIWLLAGVLVVAGLVLMVLPWVAFPDLYGKKVLLGRILGTLAGFSSILIGFLALAKNHAIVTTVDRHNRKLRIKQEGVQRTKREIPFNAIEMVTVGQKKDDHGNQVYRLGLGTRNGERVPLTRWRADAVDMLDVAKQLEQWIR